MQYRTDPASGNRLSALGLGCMRFPGYQLGRPDAKAAQDIISRAVEQGINYLDTAYLYPGNEACVGMALEKLGLRDKVFIATKLPHASCKRTEDFDRFFNEQLKRLRTDHIDLYYQHRVDPEVPIEEVAGTVGDLIREGKVLHWGLSEAGIQTIRRAHAELPLTAVQSEYSMFWREPEEQLLPTLGELGVGLVPFSPLGKGFLTGAIGRDARFGKGDFRSVVPRFTPGNIAANLSLVDFVREIAAAKGITPAQAALSWLMAQRPWIVSIPGSRSLQHLTDNIAAAGVEYTEEEMKDINERLSQIVLSGDRYPAELQARVGR